MPGNHTAGRATKQNNKFAAGIPGERFPTPESTAPPSLEICGQKYLTGGRFQTIQLCFPPAAVGSTEIGTGRQARIISSELEQRNLISTGGVSEHALPPANPSTGSN